MGFWSKPLKRPVALATFAAAASATGIWNSRQLEKDLLKRSGSYQAAQGNLRRLLQGMPAVKGNVVAMQRALPGHPIVYWANHPIFHLLDVDLHSPDFELALMFALNSIPGPLRRHFWPRSDNELPGSAHMYIAPLPDMTALIKALEDRTSHSSATALGKLTLDLAANLQAQRSRNTDMAWRTAHETCVSLTLAALFHPPLLAAYHDLTDLMMERVWKPAGMEKFAESFRSLLKVMTHFLQDKGDATYAPELLEIAGIVPATMKVSKRATRKRKTKE